MMYRLISLTGPTKGQRITVEEEPMTIGRAPDCAVSLDDPEVAREHALLEHRRDGLVIRDLGSMNRILVNKREVHEAHLKHGDMVEIGRTRFLVQAVVQAETDRSLFSSRRQRLGIAAVAAIALATGITLWMSRAEKKTPVQASAARPAPPTRAVKREDVTVATTSAPPEMTDEIRQMRKDLEHITRAVRNIAAKQATSAPPAVAAEAPAREPDAEDAAEDPQTKYNRQMFKAAQDAMSSNRLDEAEAMLAELQDRSPDFLPSYVLRANVYERRGMLEKSIGQWSQVIRRSTETPEYERAYAERIRLGEALRQTTMASAPKVRISTVTQRRFPQTDDYDEMRIFEITLAPTSKSELLEDGSVRVEVWFFDEDMKTKKVSLTRAIAPKDALVPRGVWAGGEEKSITASYVVPKGFRLEETSPESQEQFHGYIVRIFHGTELQDEVARPRTLLETATERAPATESAGEKSNAPPPAVAGGAS